MSERSGTLDPHLALEDEQELAARLADLHDRLAVRVRTLLAEREDRIEQLAREEREDARILDEPLVAAAVEEQRPTRRRSARTRPGRGRASGRRPSTSERRVRRGARARPRRAASRGRSRTSPRADRRRRLPAKRSERAVCCASSTLTPKRVPSCMSAPILARRSIETSTSGGRSETDMNAFAVMPCTCSPTRVVSTVTPVANMPSVLPERDRGVALEPLAELERLARRSRVERRAERLRRRDRAADLDLELCWPRAFHCDGF